jgi:tRNA-specific adenosine deaminase 3
MGVSPSRAKLSPEATLEEITNRELTGPMQFALGLSAMIRVRLTSTIIGSFEIEKRRYIQRVRRVDNEFNAILISYSTSDRLEITERLRELGISADLTEVSLPLWCPVTDRQRSESIQFWPLNTQFTPAPRQVEPIVSHVLWLEKVMNDKSIIVRKPGDSSTDIIVCEGNCDCNHCYGHIDHAAIRALAAASKVASANGSYLCTGLDVYSFLEPCVMCAMAMVHSRIGRLFYCLRNPDFGGIESQAQVHSNPHLNHHFLAYRLRL